MFQKPEKDEIKGGKKNDQKHGKKTKIEVLNVERDGRGKKKLEKCERVKYGEEGKER